MSLYPGFRVRSSSVSSWLAILHTSGLCIPPILWCSLTFDFPYSDNVSAYCLHIAEMTGGWHRLSPTDSNEPIHKFGFSTLALVEKYSSPVWHPKSHSLFECEYWCCYLSQYLTSAFLGFDLILVFLSNEWYLVFGESTWNDDFQRDGDNICIVFQSTAPGVNCI